MIKFRQFLNEGKGDMLDISLKEVGKVFKNEKQKADLLNTKVTVLEKYDGTKLSIIRNDQKYSKNYEDNWIVAFKGNIMYPEEFRDVDGKKIKSQSIGASQYKLVHQHLKKMHSKAKNVPRNTELFIEYMMNKPTLTRDYTHKHGMVLLATSPTKYTVNNGIIKTSSSRFNTNVSKYAKALSLNQPRILYTGKLSGFVKGEYNSTEEHLEAVRQKFLKIQSEFGGKTEGVVIKMPNGDLFKFLQADQHDTATRTAKKMKFKMSPAEENAYWKEVRTQALNFAKDVDNQNLQKALVQLGKDVYNKPIKLTHDKKTTLNVQDDVYLTTKTILIKRMKGNNGALFVGRFAPPTKAHMQIIENAFKKYDTVTLNIVKGKASEKAKNPFPIELQKKMWKTAFPKLKIQESNTGNLLTIMNKAEDNINVVLAGTDRKDAYETMLARNPDVSVEEIKRADDGISATKARNALKADDEATFKKNMDSRVWKFYDELKGYM